MEQIQNDSFEDQDIIELRREIAVAEYAKQIRRNKRRKKKILMNFLSVLSIVIVLSVIVFAFSCLRGSNIENATNSKGVVAEIHTQIVTPYENLYYYEDDKKDRYTAYQSLNPDMAVEDVVWRVNSNLDMPWYEYDVPVNSYDDPYIIVNKYNKVPDDYCPPDLVSVDGYKMRKETGQAYLELKNAAAKEGLKIRAVSAYRSVEYQDGLYKRYLSNDSQENVDRYSARPGYSEHHTGMAIDLFGSKDGLRAFIDTPEYPWVRDNCYKLDQCQ